jgi:hypothetical protein
MTAARNRPPMPQRAGKPAPAPDALRSSEDVRIGPLRPMAGVLRELGHDPAAILRASGLDATAFDDPDRRVPFRVAADLIRRGALRTGREDFGLRVGERFEFDDFGLLGQLMWRAGRVGEALFDLNRYLHLQDRGSVTYVRPAGEGLVALGYSIFDPDTPGAALIYDLVMALGVRLLRALAGPGFRAAEVWLPHVAPRQRAAYRRVFAAPLRFDAPRAEIVFDAAWLHAPVAGGDLVQHELVQRAIRLAEVGVAPGLAGRARRGSGAADDRRYVGGARGRGAGSARAQAAPPPGRRGREPADDGRAGALRGRVPAAARDRPGPAGHRRRAGLCRSLRARARVPRLGRRHAGAVARRAGRAPDQSAASSPRTTMFAWISAAPSNTFRMRASHSTRLIGYSSA